MNADNKDNISTQLAEKRRLVALFDSVQGGIITLGRDYIITSVNKYIEEWVSTPAADLVGSNAIDIFHEIGICPHCAAKTTFEIGEINSIMQSRGMNYAELTAYPIRDEIGEITESVVFIMDITERVLYQEETLSLYREVIQTKEYLESIINNSADAIVTFDLDGLITSWNQGAEKIFGFSEGDVSGNFLPFVPEVLLEKERENIDRIKKGDVLKDIETLRRKKDGSIIEVSLTLSPIKDATGDVIGISGILRDISEKKKVLKAERELAFRAAHKLGNPLYAVETELLTLRKRLEKGNYQVSEIVDAMSISIEKGKKIIEELKTLTRAETMAIQNTDILPIIRHSLRLAQQKSVKVEIECVEQVLNILSDPVGMSECFDELIANALKWLDKSEKKLSVDIGRVDVANIPLQLNRTTQFARILVADNGPGIPSDKKDLIFNPFFTTDKDGSGLGLSVVKRIIDASNGLIREIGSFGEGAIFEIYIPLAPSEGGL